MAEAPLVALRDIAIAREPDRYFAATLAPQSVRYDLITLAAFAAELDNVPMLVREPLAGEIRLQWWRDALAKGDGDAAAGHPVAAAMRATIDRHALPLEIVEAVIGSYTDVLYGDRPADELALAARMAAGEGGLFQLAARICAAGGMGTHLDNARAAGLAYGLSRALLRLPGAAIARLAIPRSLLSDEELAALRSGDDSPKLTHAMESLVQLARAALAEVAPEFAKMSRERRLPLLPLAMVRPNLHALEAWTKRRDAAPIDPLRIGRLIRILWVHARGRL